MSSATIPANPGGKNKSRQKRKKRIKIYANLVSMEEFEKRQYLNDAREEIASYCEEIDQYLAGLKGKA